MTIPARALITLIAAVVVIGPPALARQCPPAAPSELDATDGDFCDHVALSWNTVGGASWYEVWRSLGTDYNQASLIGTPVTTTFNDSAVIPGTHYYYWVTAWRVPCAPGSSRSGPSGRNQGTAGGGGTLPTPSNFSATPGCGQVDLSWSPVGGVVTYLVQRTWFPIDGVETSEILGSTPSTDFTDDHPRPDTPVRYWIRASNLCGSTSNPATTDWLVAHAEAPGPILNMIASDGNRCGSVLVAWSRATDEDTYEVWREPPPPGSGIVRLAQGITDFTYTDTTAVGGVIYTYVVRAINPCGQSSSDPDTGFAPCAADFNCSGTVTVQDIFDFLAAYFSDDPRADFNGAGGVSVQDIFDFLAAYFAGCP